MQDGGERQDRGRPSRSIGIGQRFERREEQVFFLRQVRFDLIGQLTERDGHVRIARVDRDRHNAESSSRMRGSDR